MGGWPDLMGPYRIRGVLGRGGQGVVLEAEDSRLGRSVALKLLGDAGRWGSGARARFEQEASLAARVDHPGVCRVYEVGEWEGVPYIAFQRVSGKTLQEILRTEPGGPDSDRRSAPGPMAIGHFVTLAVEVARALEAAHAAGIVHRDLKPGNIMVTPEGRAVVLDFGLARDLGDNRQLTQSGETFGTPTYMAPEQLRGLRDGLDGRCDVWALGVTLYEAVCGSPPFAGATHEQLMEGILRKEPVEARRLNGHVSRDLSAVLGAALEKSLTRRYRSAAALADDLQRVLDGRPVVAKRIGPLARSWRWCQRNPALAAAVATAVVALGGGLGVSLVERARADGEATKASLTLAEYERLADVQRLEDLLHEARFGLVPVRNDRVADLDGWIRQAEALVARLPEHEGVLARLRADALSLSRESLRERHRRLRPEVVTEVENLEAQAEHLDAVIQWVTEQNSARAEAQLPELRDELAGVRQELSTRWALLESEGARSFSDPSKAVRFDGLAGLVSGLKRLDSNDAGEVTLSSMKERRALAASLLRRSVVDRAAEWAASQEYVRNHPPYDGLVLLPMEGLVPLGPDPHSGCLEFVDLLSGEPPTLRGPDGGWRIEEGTGIVYVLIPGGSFLMGAQSLDPLAPRYDPRSEEDEGPVFQVNLKPFLMGKFEVTQGQWIRITGLNPSYFRAGSTVTGTEMDRTFPVESVSWAAAQDGLRQVGARLPTEAQWERATRGGNDWVYVAGDDPESLAGYCNLADEGSVDYYIKGWRYERGTRDGYASTAPVGSFKPNGFGLHDVLGNVSEWCAGRLELYPGRVLAGQVSGFAWSRYPVRGGNFDSTYGLLRCSDRFGHPAEYRSAIIGVRAARSLPE